jgi:hypothetical protein
MQALHLQGGGLALAAMFVVPMHTLQGPLITPHICDHTHAHSTTTTTTTTPRPSVAPQFFQGRHLPRARRVDKGVHLAPIPGQRAAAEGQRLLFRLRPRRGRHDRTHQEAAEVNKSDPKAGVAPCHEVTSPRAIRASHHRAVAHPEQVCAPFVGSAHADGGDLKAVEKGRESDGGRCCGRSPSPGPPAPGTPAGASGSRATPAAVIIDPNFPPRVRCVAAACEARVRAHARRG